MQKQILTWVFTLSHHGLRDGPGVLNGKMHFDFILFLCFSPHLGVALFMCVFAVMPSRAERAGQGEQEKPTPIDAPLHEPHWSFVPQVSCRTPGGMTAACRQGWVWRQTTKATRLGRDPPASQGWVLSSAFQKREKGWGWSLPGDRWVRAQRSPCSPLAALLPAPGRLLESSEPCTAGVLEHLSSTAWIYRLYSLYQIQGQQLSEAQG